MHVPFLEPLRFQNTRRNLAQQGRDVRTSERREPVLVRRGKVGIPCVERRANATGKRITRRRRQQDEQGMKIGLVKHINMDPLRYVTSRADVTAELVGLLDLRRR